MRIISGILILITAILSFRHSWGGVTNHVKPEEAAKLASWGISPSMNMVLSYFNIAVAILILFPKTFLWGNILGACLFVVMMGFQLSSGNLKAALIEIPFFAVPLILIYLGHPFQK